MEKIVVWGRKYFQKMINEMSKSNLNNILVLISNQVLVKQRRKLDRFVKYYLTVTRELAVQRQPDCQKENGFWSTGII